MIEASSSIMTGQLPSYYAGAPSFGLGKISYKKLNHCRWIDINIPVKL